MEYVSLGKREKWSDRVHSVLVDEQLDLCRDRLLCCSERSVFDSLSPLEQQNLFARSYYASEGRRPPLEALREHVLKNAEEETQYLSFGEDALVKRMLIHGGELYLDDPDQLPYAESLIRRLFCTIRFDDEEEARLRLCPQIAEKAAAAYTLGRVSTREILFRVEAMVHSIIYLYGFVYADSLSGQLIREINAKQGHISPTFLTRFLKASFLYTYNREGRLFLPHPGLWDPERVLDEKNALDGSLWRVSFEMMLGGMNGMLAEEKPAVLCMADALRNALQPEADLDETLTDLRIIAKQGATFADMRSVLDERLCVAPNDRILGALRRMQAEMVPWTGSVKAVLN